MMYLRFSDRRSEIAMKQDLHVHTIFSDGKSTAEEVVLSAIKKGLDRIGFSDHSYTTFDNSYCISKDNLEKYLSCIHSLKEKYADKIEVLCGIEQEYFSHAPTDCYDYVIGSVHYVKVSDRYIPVDESADILRDAAERYFSGDIYSLVEEYYKCVGDVIEKTNADIIGHLDLITKFCEKTPLFDMTSPRYLKAAKAAIDKLLPYGKPFEINTGAISRGYRTTPYPSAELTDYIKSRGGKFILSSDSHRADTVCFGFDEI